MSEFGDVWEASVRKSRPIEDWHWLILERDLLEEFAVIRLIEEYKDFPGKTFGEKIKVGGPWGRNGSTCRWPDPSAPYGDAAKEIVADCWKIIAAIRRKFEQNGRRIPV